MRHAIRSALLAAALLAACSSSSSSPPTCPPSVDDGNACTADACDPATGLVSHVPVAVDDGSACTTDACDPATGVVSHTPVAIDDGDACTTDACDPVAGVTHVPLPVDDGVACTVDACLAGVVAHTPSDAACAPDGYCDVTAGCLPLPVLEGVDPQLAYVHVGQSSVATIPSPLTVRLSAPARGNTFVAVGSSSAAVEVTGGGTTVPDGATSAAVLVTGVSAGTATLTATLDGRSFQAAVRAVDPLEQPAVADLGAATSNLVPGATVTFTVTLDIPAPAPAVEVALAVSPDGAGALPATVAVPEGQVSATFDYVDGGTAGSVTVTASLGASSASWSLVPGALVINEVDYDQPGTDTDEFVELLNRSAAPIALDGIALYLVNGSNGVSYLRVPLSGTLDAGSFALVASTTVVGGPVLRFDFALPTNNVQNGAPDAIALVDEASLTVLDAVAYELSMGPATLGALPGTYEVMETAPAPADPALGAESICRVPDGQDTDDNSADFVVCPTATPGAVNAGPP